MTQPDTIVPDLNNPQALNRYSYVLNNPIRYTDPTGHWIDPGCGSGDLCELSPEKEPEPGSWRPDRYGDVDPVLPDPTSDMLRCNIDIYCDVQTSVFTPIPGSDVVQYAEIEPEMLTLGPWAWVFIIAGLVHNGITYSEVNFGAEMPWKGESAATVLMYSDSINFSKGLKTSIDYLIIANQFPESIKQTNIGFEFDNRNRIERDLFIEIAPNSNLVIPVEGMVLPPGVNVTVTIDMYTANYQGNTIHTIYP